MSKYGLLLINYIFPHSLTRRFNFHYRKAPKNFCNNFSTSTSQFLRSNSARSLCYFHRYCGCKLSHNLALISTTSFSTSIVKFSTVVRTPIYAPVMKISSEKFRSLFTDELKYLAELFKKYDYEIRIAGGAVRDLLMDIQPADMDFATTATPQQMYDMFTKEHVRMLNKKGEKHGTVTCRVNDKENFEITTLRIDILCDGRHAEVEFTTDWLKDASRRDLTVNAMFLDLEGNLYDFFNGVRDLENRRIAFVGDAEQRIREDYLRILRYFRFYGRLARSPDDHQQETLDAITANASGLAGISGERLWSEFKKIVIGQHAGPIMRRMIDCGIAPYLGLPAKPNIDEFQKVVEGTEGMEPKSMTRIAALLDNEEQVHIFDKRVKMSVAERLLGVFVVNRRTHTDSGGDADAQTLKFYQDLIMEEKFRPSPGGDGEDRVYELLKYQGRPELLQALQEWSLTKPKFPVNGEMLAMKAGLKPGKKMREALDYLFDVWKKNDYKMDDAGLLQELNAWREKQEKRSPSPTAAMKKKGKVG